VIGPGKNFLTRVGSIFCCSGRVSHLWFESGFEKFPLKIPNFSKKSLLVGSKSTWVKDRSASYLRQFKSMLRLGQGPSLTAIDLKAFVSQVCRGWPKFAEVWSNMQIFGQIWQKSWMKKGWAWEKISLRVKMNEKSKRENVIYLICEIRTRRTNKLVEPNLT